VYFAFGKHAMQVLQREIADQAWGFLVIKKKTKDCTKKTKSMFLVLKPSTFMLCVDRRATTFLRWVDRRATYSTHSSDAAVAKACEAYM
jgi:hypothetical protein